MSSKLRQASSNPEEEAKIDMSPMIDMVFLLLLFFLVNATAIIVKTDPKVKPPIAKNSKRQEEGRGRIVVNVRADGTFTNESFVILPDEKAITDYVNEMRKKIANDGLKPKLHLRGDQSAIFKYCRTAIRAAAQAKVIEVVFAVYHTHQGLKIGE